MNRMDGFDRLLAEFGEAIGIPEMAFDEDGLCHIRVDEEYPITFRRDDEQHNLVLVGLIAEELPQQLDRELVKEMLATGVEPLRDNGAALGLEPQSGTLILHQTMPLAKISRPLLEEMLGGFILMQKDWSARMTAAAAASPAKPAADATRKPGENPAGKPGAPAANAVLGAARPRPAAAADTASTGKRPAGAPSTTGAAGAAGAAGAGAGGKPAMKPVEGRAAQGGAAPSQAKEGKGPPAGQPAPGTPRVHPDINRR